MVQITACPKEIKIVQIAAYFSPMPWEAHNLSDAVRGINIYVKINKIICIYQWISPWK